MFGWLYTGQHRCVVHERDRWDDGLGFHRGCAVLQHPFEVRHPGNAHHSRLSTIQADDDNALDSRWRGGKITLRSHF